MRTLFGAANGLAYRFKLPVVGLPPPGGDRVRVELAYVADSHAHLLATDEPLCQHLAHARLAYGKVHVVQLVLDNVLWLLPMTQKKNATEVVYSSIQADRWVLQGCEEEASRAPPSPLLQLPPKEFSLFYRKDWNGFRPRWDKLYAAPYDYRPRIPPPKGYGPLSTRASHDPDIVAQIPDVYADRDSESEDEWDDLEVEEELPINVVLKQPVKFTRYVDVLPRGDHLPLDAKLVDRRLAPNDVWAINQELQTYFIATKIEPGVRRLAWHQLTTPSLGLSGEVTSTGGEVNYLCAGLTSVAYFKPGTFKPGPAVIKLLPVGDEYTCQPTSASPAASYIFNNWRLVVEQDDKQVDKYTTRAEYIVYDALHHLELLAELASAEGAPGRIVYAQRPYWYGERISGVGVRLRDGGSRFELEEVDNTTSQFKLPADRYLHSKWGRFDGKAVGAELHPKTPVMAHLRVPAGSQPQDAIFRVKDSEVGDYKHLEYALRPRGSCKAIKEDEWQPVDPSILDEWIICLFLNMAKVTWGCFNRDLIRPSSASNADETSQPLPAMATAAVNTANGEAAASSSSARDAKKPRLA